MFDCIIKGGTLIDGLGDLGETGDLAISDGKIAEVGGRIGGSTKRVIDADGALVTPGWIDLHTHYDGQVSWDTEISPSSHNGVTTVIMGNCGVGFAPVNPGTETELIELMEGVEDIPGTALHEGMEWGQWETFPDYLDYLSEREFSLDVGAHIAHGPLRYFAMGERGRVNEDATESDMALMSDLVSEAIEAGALGFSTNRTSGHRSLWGEPVPGTYAPDEELLAIARGMKKVGKGVFQMIPSGTVGKLGGIERSTPQEEHNLMRRFSIESGRPATFTLVQSPDFDPNLWREILQMNTEANEAGAQLFPQVSSRPIGFLTGLSGYHAFMRRPTYLRDLANLPLAERAIRMRDPEVRKALMTETDIAPDEPGSMENIYGLFNVAAPGFYPLSDPVDYEPDPSESIGARAVIEGREPLECMYDFLLEDEGTRFASLAAADVSAAMEVIREMLTHPDTVTGLSDAGAHAMLICDGSMPTTQLSFWARDRVKGDKIPIEFLVNKQTSRNALLYGFGDRGTLEVGKRADVNVIDHENLTVSPPAVHSDLPQGGKRLVQPVGGYVATLCNGVVTREMDSDTGNRPGRLVRS
ncbi:MAG: amidohydrolase family protein [Acidimicrobiales bacterium]|nr:amidohydrolase family protein [Acidimicrobiales bacterium]MDP6298721.1 amidohydrolase family protein [Acidimicrobiales bacterium]HJM28039.1 amidohydrolase family protein [Acidimicrobiales bacterium]HJM96614.1 amidohydrolase family protein [Acidimicrobiales bacterium]